MNAPILEVQPRELQFIFELKKQSSCEVRLTNNTFHNVAFKIKTTSPKKYCVRPNVGIVLPKSTSEFVVTMQAPKAPPEIQCKDKFLIQSTVVPVGISDKDITPLMFNKGEGKFIEEIKLKVVFISPPQSPVLSPINGVLKQGPPFDPSVLGDQILSKVDNTANAKVHSIARNEKDVEMKSKKDVSNVQELKPAKNIVLPNIDFFNGEELNLGKNEKLKQVKDAIDDKFAKDVELPLPVNRVHVTFIDQMSKDAEFPPKNAVKDAFIDQQTKDAKFPLPENTEKDAIIDERVKGPELSLPNKAGNDSIVDTPMKDAELSTPEKAVKYADFVTANAVKELKLVSDIEEMKSKLNHLETKLNEAESIITNLTEERKLSVQERKNLQEELILLRSGTNAKRLQVGFPLLFVVMVALVSIFLGYLSHP
ncbi:vesicle-associated protein 2-2-like [Euphorbia lathyris]|uniref:vesicle-associated protein 2-2-like n=1 Tax=Euphorbia lathyris TaxID=212925 RepID=UPI003313E373